MYGGRDKAMVPRNGHTLTVGIVARISGCANQKELSLEDQEDHGREVARDLYDGHTEFEVIATKGKGERLDRPELEQIEAKLREGKLDLLVMEDLGRLVRGAEAVRLLGIAVDHGIRTVSPNDGVDTNEPTWEADALAVTHDHVSHQAHGSKRIKHKKMNRFIKFGGSPACPPYGYVVPEAAVTYHDWKLDETATPLIREAFEILKETLNCSAVAEYFNNNKAPVGPYCRRKSWDGKMVRRFFRNRILGGMPTRGRMHTVKHHETGRRVSVKNPNGPKFHECLHLAHLDIKDLDEVNAILDQRNHGCGRKPVNGVDPLLRVPRKRSRFPGHCACCLYCGGDCVWGGNGMKGNLMCSRAREWKCWNSMGHSGALAAQKVVECIIQMVGSLQGFDAQFRELVRAAGTDASGEMGRRWEQLLKDEAAHARQKQNLQESLAAFGPIPLVKEQMTQFQNRERALSRERRELEAFKSRTLNLPPSVAELRAMLAVQFDKLATNSYECGDLLRKLVPEFHVYLVRLCNGGHPLPRARVTIALDGILPDAKHVPGLAKLLTRTFTIDLFVPPQRERIRETAVRLGAQGHGPKEIARRIPGIIPEKPTSTAVQNALALHAKMQQLGLDSPYIILREPPEDYPKLRRHKNSKYRFEPREGYQPPEIEF